MVAVAEPAARSAVLDVAAAELGDDGVLDRLRHRVRVKRIGRAWLALGAPPIGDSSSGGGSGGGGGDEEALDQVLPVIGETANRIRVVAEEDEARVAAWIDRRDAWESIVAPVALDEARGPAGVWLDAGAPIAAGPKGQGLGHDPDPKSTSRAVTLRSSDVAAQGAVPAAFIGHVWLVPHDDRSPTDMVTCSVESWQAPEDRRPRGMLDEGVVIRAAAAGGARVLATLTQGQEAYEVSRGGAWVEVELVQQFVRIRGWVPASAFGESGGTFQGGLACGGRGFGMSHADHIEVPAGTCLYDKSRGEVAGVALTTKVRLGSRAGGAGAGASREWSMVYVDTRWSLAQMYVRDTGRDPAQPVFESCTARGPRR